MGLKPQSNIAGVILAGGLSRRMGKEKAFVPLAGRPLIAHSVAVLRPQVQALAINANGPTERFASFGLPILPDPIDGRFGPLAGILAALEWAKAQGFAKVVTVPVDIPFLPADFVANLAAALANNDLARARSGDRQHFAAALFRSSLAADLRDAGSNNNLRKVEDWQAHYKVAIAEWPGDPIDPFFNVNTVEDLAAAERHASGGVD